MSVSIERALGRIEGKLDAIATEQQELKEKHLSHNIRISSIEGFKIQVITISGFVAAGISGLWQLVKVKIGA